MRWLPSRHYYPTYEPDSLYSPLGSTKCPGKNTHQWLLAINIFISRVRPPTRDVSTPRGMHASGPWRHAHSPRGDPHHPRGPATYQGEPHLAGGGGGPHLGREGVIAVLPRDFVCFGWSADAADRHRRGTILYVPCYYQSQLSQVKQSSTRAWQTRLPIALKRVYVKHSSPIQQMSYPFNGVVLI